MFVVIWTDRALDRLADIVVAVDLTTQDRITGAVEALNRRLARDPLVEGESREGTYRLTFVEDLAVRFRVDSTKHVVRVTEIQHRGR